MKRTRKDALATKSRILDAAEFAFSEVGVSGTSMEDIAVRAGLTRGAIYGHFKNKDAVFGTMVARLNVPFYSEFIASIQKNEQDPLACIRRLIVSGLTEISTNRRTRNVLDIVLLKCEMSADAFALQSRNNRHRRRLHNNLVHSLRIAVEKGQLSPYLDLQFTAKVAQATVEGLIREWLAASGPIALPRDAERIATVVLDLICLRSSLEMQSTGQ